MDEKLYDIGCIDMDADLIDSLSNCYNDYNFISFGTTPRRIYDVVITTRNITEEEKLFYHIFQIPVVTGKQFEIIEINLANAIKKVKPVSAKLHKYRRIIDKHQFINEKIEEIEGTEIGHAMRVGLYAHSIAKSMHLSSGAILDIYLAALMHEIGKIYIPKHMLSKKGKLSDEEFAEIELHTEYGYELLKFDLPEEIACMVKYHSLKGTCIAYSEDMHNIGANIIALADSYDTMTKKLNKINKKSKIDAINELKLYSKDKKFGGKGILFDPFIVNTFITNLK